MRARLYRYHSPRCVASLNSARLTGSALNGRLQEGSAGPEQDERRGDEMTSVRKRGSYQREGRMHPRRHRFIFDQCGDRVLMRFR